MRKLFETFGESFSPKSIAMIANKAKLETMRNVQNHDCGHAVTPARNSAQTKSGCKIQQLNIYTRGIGYGVKSLYRFLCCRQCPGELRLWCSDFSAYRNAFYQDIRIRSTALH